MASGWRWLKVLRGWDEGPWPTGGRRDQSKGERPRAEQVSRAALIVSKAKKGITVMYWYDHNVDGWGYVLMTIGMLALGAGHHWRCAAGWTVRPRRRLANRTPHP